MKIVLSILIGIKFHQIKFYVDITNVFSDKVEMIRFYKSVLENKLHKFI